MALLDSKPKSLLSGLFTKAHPETAAPPPPVSAPPVPEQTAADEPAPRYYDYVPSWQKSTPEEEIEDNCPVVNAEGMAQKLNTIFKTENAQPSPTESISKQTAPIAISEPVAPFADRLRSRVQASLAQQIALSLDVTIKEHS